MTQAENNVNRSPRSNKKQSGLNVQNPSLMLILLICRHPILPGSVLRAQPADAHPIDASSAEAGEGSGETGCTQSAHARGKAIKALAAPFRASQAGTARN